MSNSGAKISAPLLAMLFNMLKYGQIAIITGERHAGADQPITNKIFVDAFDPLLAKTINNL